VRPPLHSPPAPSVAAFDVIPRRIAHLGQPSDPAHCSQGARRHAPGPSTALPRSSGHWLARVPRAPFGHSLGDSLRSAPSPSEPPILTLHPLPPNSHYLAPEVAKLPQSSTAPADPLAFTFGADDSSNAVAGPSSASTFDPSTFMPTIPGSPVGAFSPSSDGNSSHRSPMSFPDLDFSAMSDPFALDPSIFGVSAGLDYGMPVDAIDSSLTYTPATSTASDTPLSVLPNAPLPPLPNMYLGTTSTSAPSEQPQQASAAPAPAAAGVELTASGRPKRTVAHSVLDAADDDDEAMYSSDASDATTTRKASTRGSSRKPSAAKKARASSSGASDAGAAAAAHASAAAAEAKRLARTSVVPLASSDLHKTTANSKLPPVPQWADKPDPDEYQKLSSKEKRQMRNKISARNFRHRRKGASLLALSSSARPSSPERRC